MDPHATWRDMQNALIDEDADYAVELAEALLSWLQRGGFPPIVGDKDLPYGWHRQIAKAGAEYVLTAAGVGHTGEKSDPVVHSGRNRETQR